MILAGSEIDKRNIIKPFYHRMNYEYEGRRFTYGCGPGGYDVRVEFDNEDVDRIIGLQPQEFRLASTIEHFHMPNDVQGEVKDKSSWARRGLTVQNTVIEAGWCGHLTLELINHSNEVIILRTGMPIAQIVFHLIYGKVEPYEGKYQNQERGPQGAR